jgi:hypothetical protein
MEHTIDQVEEDFDHNLLDMEDYSTAEAAVGVVAVRSLDCS